MSTRSEPPGGVVAQIAQEAVELVTGARRERYGPAEKNFERTARFWTAYLQNVGKDVTITARDISPMMRLLKEARLCKTPGDYDSLVDLIGYTLTGAEREGAKK